MSRRNFIPIIEGRDNQKIYLLLGNKRSSELYDGLFDISIGNKCTLSAYVGDGKHEKEIDAQNAKMSGLNQHKEVNMGFVSNLTSVCVSYFDFVLALSKELSFLFFCMKVFCRSPRRLVMITILLTLSCLLMLVITAEACKQMVL